MVHKDNLVGNAFGFGLRKTLTELWEMLFAEFIKFITKMVVVTNPITARLLHPAWC